ncbi:hypothetical protein Bca4012_011190 [Brassica carinata]
MVLLLITPSRRECIIPAVQGSTGMGEIDPRFSRTIWIRGVEEEEDEEGEKRGREKLTLRRRLFCGEETSEYTTG